MAKRYSVAPPSTGTGGAKLLYAGGGRVGGGGIPKAAPGGFSIDLGLDKMRQKGEDDEKRKYLIEGGLDPKAVALMDTQSLDMGVRAMSDDLIEAEKAKGEAEFSKELADFIKFGKGVGIKKKEVPVEEGIFGGEFAEDFPLDDGEEYLNEEFLDKENKGYKELVEGDMFGEESHPDGEQKDFYGDGSIKEITNWKNGVKHGDNTEYYEDGTIKSVLTYDKGELISEEILDRPDYSGMKPKDELLARFMGLSPRAATEPRAISAYETAKKRLTPKEVDPWTHSASMMVGDDHVTYDKAGNELRRIKLPKDTDWQEITGWIGDKQGSFFRDKDDPNVYIWEAGWEYRKDKKPKFHPVPKGFSRVRPRAEKSLSMKFNAFLETNEDYKGIVETHKVNGKKVLLDPKDLYINGSGPEQKAAIEFFRTEDGTVALIKALTELQKTRNKGDAARRKKLDALIKQKEGR